MPVNSGVYRRKDESLPFESRLFVKTSIVGLALTFFVGAVVLIAEALGNELPPIVGIEHAHLGFVGWLVNLVIGIALWFLPLNRKAFPAMQGRYPRYLPETIFTLLNGGLALRLVSEPFLYSAESLARPVLIFSAVAQFAAIVLFGYVAWLRVRGPANPAPGVR
jgi:hypothetical protein